MAWLALAQRPGGSTGWAFPGGSPGFELRTKDPADLAQNPDGTGAVTAPGDPVGYVKDKTGNGHHAKQSDPAKKGTWTADGYVALAAGQSLVVDYTSSDSTVGWGYLDGGEVAASQDLSSGTFVIDTDFYGLTVVDGSLTEEQTAALDAELDALPPTPTLTPAFNLRGLFIPD